jgi:trehalose 6-phosphate phosphatase
VFVDFDGTLSPIVRDPDQARPLRGAVAAMGRVAARYARAAVISGRPASYLVEHLLPAAGGTELIGLYGLERVKESQAASGATIEVAPAARRWQPAIDAAADSAESTAPAGLLVERKGLAVTLHFRSSPTLGGWAERFARECAERSGLVAHPGKMSWELRPPLSVDKGTVVAELAAGLKAVVFIGDDTGDLPAFAELSRLRDRGVATAAVMAGGPETPVALVERADLVVDGPAGVVDLLEWLAGPGSAP